jgi:hypothetical protein
MSIFTMDWPAVIGSIAAAVAIQKFWYWVQPEV